MSKDIEAIAKAAVKLREAEADLGRKLLPFTINGGDLADLSSRIGIKAPLLRELTAVALGVRKRHGESLKKLKKLNETELKQAG